MLPLGFNTPLRTLRETAMEVILQSCYELTPLAAQPINHHTPLQPERNEEIRRRYAAGETGAKLAREYGLSKSRIFRIIHWDGLS